MIDHTTIIAEAGVNHNGSIDLAKQLIDIAAEAGADFIKFQTFNAERLVTRTAKKANYQIEKTNSDELQYDMLRRLELTETMHQDLIAYCVKRKIGFLSTGFDIESVNLLLKLGQTCFKVPSGEITNLLYLQHIGQFSKSIILSTGMATLDEIETAINILEEVGTPRNKLTVLHCTSEYPAPMNEVNLRVMHNIHKTFGVTVGYSDHTLGIEVPIAAVAMGARVIEKHFTISRSLSGPDHKASLEPDELKNMIIAIRNIEMALGDGIKRVTPNEIQNKLIVRKSLVAKRAIRINEIFTTENIAVKRPGNGISPMCLNKVLGKKALRNFLIDELIEI